MSEQDIVRRLHALCAGLLCLYSALLALALFPVVRADRRAATFFTAALLTLVLAEVGASAVLAGAPAALVFADQRPAAFFTEALDAAVLADHGASALFTLVLVAVMYADA